MSTLPGRVPRRSPLLSTGQGPLVPSSRRAELLLAMGAVLGAAILGTRVVTDGVAALLPIVVLAGSALLFLQPFVGVLLVVATVPLEYVFLAGEGVTATRLLAAGLGLLWLAGKVIRRESFRPLLASGLLVPSLLLIGLVFASRAWAMDPGEVQVGVLQLAMLFLWTLIVVDTTSTEERLQWLLRVLLFSGSIAALLTLVQYGDGAVSRAGDGVAGGVNGTAEMLVLMLPLAFLHVQKESIRPLRLLSGAFILLALVAIPLTFSRMALLVLGPVLAIQLWQMRRWRSGRIWLLGLLAGIAVVGARIPWDEVSARGESIVPYLQGFGSPGTAAAPTASGRAFHLRVSFALFRDHPLIGVGYNNFGEHFRDSYQYDVPGARKVWRADRSPHSSHAGMLAELGIVGALVWGIFLAVPVARLLRARSLLRGAPDGLARGAVRALLFILLVEIVAYGWYSPIQKEKYFWLVVGLCMIVYRLARAQVSHPRAESLDAAIAAGASPALRS